MKRNPEYIQGASARRNFEATMAELFRAPKPPKPKKQPKKKAASEEKKN
jgi:hypothetical protein